MLAGVYQPRWVPTRLRDGRTVTAVTFVVDTAHCQYCGDLPMERAAHHIAFAEGRRGACRDYLANTAAMRALWASTIPTSKSWCNALVHSG